LISIHSPTPLLVTLPCNWAMKYCPPVLCLGYPATFPKDCLRRSLAAEDATNCAGFWCPVLPLRVCFLRELTTYRFPCIFSRSRKRSLGFGIGTTWGHDRHCFPIQLFAGRNGVQPFPLPGVTRFLKIPRSSFTFFFFLLFDSTFS